MGRHNPGGALSVPAPNRHAPLANSEEVEPSRRLAGYTICAYNTIAKWEWDHISEAEKPLEETLRRVLREELHGRGSKASDVAEPTKPYDAS